ncbi:rho GTPase-activating protein [Trema orientale]|uniref:Rho GTPase-activating protein n=1 Tax=Trema orientale TaxID=63057 RepID=A0A2P5FZZ0_TREOI|nr:rho GTPase-activating protein [Trema orientale]
MGTCLSTKKPSSPSSSSSSSSTTTAINGGSAINGVSSTSSGLVVPIPVQAVDPVNLDKKQEDVKEEEHPTQVKKEIFIIKHRRSHDDRAGEQPNPKHQNHPPLVLAAAAPDEDDESPSSPAHQLPVSAAAVRTSSCTKEEVDAILIQCGRLSRSSSGKAASSSSASRKYSGSKRSYDFDHGDAAAAAAAADGDGAVTVTEESRRHRDRRQSSRSRTRASPSPQGRRRTPSRERGDGQQRSASRERRVSRSPGRRSSTEASGGGTCSNTNTNTNTSAVSSNRPGKMVSVPATVSSLVMDKSNNGDSAAAAAVKRISVKRNVGEAGAGAGAAASRGAASPRSQSPARANGNAAAVKSSSSDCQQQQQPSLSRNSSRKAEHSPYRRNPLSEIDPNSLAYPHTTNTTNNNRTQSKSRSRETEGVTDEIFTKEPSSNVTNQVQKPNAGTNYRSGSRVSGAKEQQATVETTVLISGSHKSSSQTPTPTITRSRSARRSRDLDFNPETLLHPNSNSNSDSTPSYTRLLLEDIQNFHQKNTTTTTTTVVSLPPCVSKACSILEAVADLNSTTSSNLSEDQFNSLMGSTPKSKDPFVESEVVIGCDDLTEPSFHKYVTVTRGGGDAAAEDQESSGSNSFVQQQQQWGSGLFSSSSADSMDCRTWRSNDEAADGKRRLSERNKRDSYAAQPHSSGGIGRGRLGSAKGLQAFSVVAST